MRALLVCLLMAAGPARAYTPSSGDFGLGLTLGSLVAVNGKYWLDNRGALSFGLGNMSSHWTVLYGEYLFHIPGLFGKSTKFGRETYAYAGGGDAYGYYGGYGHGYAAAPISAPAAAQYAGSAAPAPTVLPASYSGGFYSSPSYWYGN